MKKFVILLSGKMRSGKNQFAEYLDEEIKKAGLTVRHDLYAKDLKDGCKEDFKRLANVLLSLRAEIESTVGSYLDLKRMDTVALSRSLNKLVIRDHNWYEDKTNITRAILQIYGTEIFRKRVSDNYWAEKVRDRVIECSEEVSLITDCRFPNEITVFDRENLGKHKDSIIPVVVRINRSINTNKQVSDHPSETSLDDWQTWDYIIDNNGSLDDLRDSAMIVVRNILNGE